MHFCMYAWVQHRPRSPRQWLAVVSLVLGPTESSEDVGQSQMQSSCQG